MSFNFSASRLKTWMKCPMQAHLKYDLKEPTGKDNAKAVFGKAIHASLEYYNNGGSVTGTLAMFKDLWNNPEKLGSPVENLWWPKFTSFQSLKERGVAVIKTFDEQCDWDKRTVIATEHPFLVPFGEFFLTGYVDLLEMRRSGKGKDLLRVVDYKTNSRRPNMAELVLDIQFTVYMWAVEQPEFWFGAKTVDGGPNPDFPPVENAEWAWEMYHDLPRRAIWYHLWDHKEIDAGPRVDTDFLRMYRVCTEIMKAHTLDVHVPSIGDACLFCDFKDPCAMQVTIPTREQLLEQPTAWI